MAISEQPRGGDPLRAVTLVLGIILFVIGILGVLFVWAAISSMDGMMSGMMGGGGMMGGAMTGMMAAGAGPWFGLFALVLLIGIILTVSAARH